MNKKLKHIELFAGCGGMTLGLERAGFELFFANELSPMAGETFAYNLLQEKLERNGNIGKVKWLRSQFQKHQLSERLKENPIKAALGPYSDMTGNMDLKGKLLIGDINLLLKFLETFPEIVSSLQDEDVDLISGGPPCQSFSLAGKREKENYKNILPWSFANIAGLIKPKTIILENVKGITAPFTENGEKYYAWLEVSKAFAINGFVPICMMINSKYFGVAQNRPRFIMIAYREDIFQKLLLLNQSKSKILQQSSEFFKKVNSNINKVTIRDLNYYDIEENPELFDGIIFPKITTPKENFIKASEAIGDIRNTRRQYTLKDIDNGYGESLNRTFIQKEFTENYMIKNHDPRMHHFEVKARFRFYQVINEFQNGLKKTATRLFTGRLVSAGDLDILFEEFAHYNLYFKDGEDEYYKKPKSIHEVEMLIKKIPSKKHSQRALKENEPAPAQLTIPDDLCHYHMENLRTLTVREMARFQSFPDWFEFKSKVTTGGKMRSYEVPQYTQVGNAVPPLLAKALGETVKKQLRLTNN